METHDNYLVKIDAKTGKEIWHVEISPFEQQYFSSMAPIVIGDHVIVGTGNDLDAPGYLQSFDPETGKRQWILYTVPMNAGDPGVDTWPSLEAARHGGAQPWVPGAYDPETHLYIFGTGNPTPAYTPAARGIGVGLFTCSLVAVNVDTGKMAWYYQTSPRDMHDWDSAQTPISDRRHDRRPSAQAGVDGRAERLFLHRRSRYRRAHRQRQVQPGRQLGERPRCEGTADPEPRKSRDDRRLDRQRQRDELAAAGVFSRHRALLCAREQQSLDSVSDRRRSARARWDSAACRAGAA